MLRTLAALTVYFLLAAHTSLVYRYDKDIPILRGRMFDFLDEVMAARP